MTGFSGRDSFKQAPCQNCGKVASGHEKERVYNDNGPAGAYHYVYECPDGSGVWDPV